MPEHRLTKAWVVIARSGQCIRLTNVGDAPVVLSGTDQQVPPGGSALHASLPADLKARAAAGVTTIVVSVTPGLSAEP